jgi:CRP/FNR family transcriptional regulator
MPAPEKGISVMQTAQTTATATRHVPIQFHGAATATAARYTPHCSTCHLRVLCIPSGLTNEDVEKVGALIQTRRKVKRGDTLYRSSDPFKSLYAVRSGFFKSYIVTEDGREHVTGFQMAGEIIGMDGIEDEHHHLNVVALEECEVCVIPYARLEEVASRIPALQRQFHRMMSREIVRDHGVMTLLGTMRAEERVAAFLLGMSQRFVARGYAAAEFYLRMTREEIGSYLGLKLETVSRIFSRFQECGLIGIHQKHVHILDVQGLTRVMSADARAA